MKTKIVIAAFLACSPALAEPLQHPPQSPPPPPAAAHKFNLEITDQDKTSWGVMAPGLQQCIGSVKLNSSDDICLRFNQFIELFARRIKEAPEAAPSEKP